MGAVLAHLSTITIENCTFKKNHVKGDTKDKRIDIEVETVLTVVECDFWLLHSCFIENSGRALWIENWSLEYVIV